MRSDLRSANQPILKQQQVIVRGEPVAIPSGGTAPRAEAPAGPPASDKPDVQLIRADDGSVRSIRVRCACGREITLQCEYFADGGEHEKGTP